MINAVFHSLLHALQMPVKVKYLGEDGENTPVAGAASICSPWDLVVS